MTGAIAAIIGTTGQDGGVSLPSSISVLDVEIAPTDATASFTISSAGTYASVGNGSSPSGTWLNIAPASDYDVMFTTSDTPSGDLTNTWLNLASSRSWSVTDATVNGAPVTAVGTLSIRRSASGVVIDSCSLSIWAEKDI